MPSQAQLERMRDAQGSIMPDTVQVKRRVKTDDGMGGSTLTWPDVTYTYKGRMSSRGVPGEYLSMSRVQGRQLWMVTLPHDADVLRTDRLAIGGVTLEILGFASGGAWMTALRAVCVEVT